MNTTELETMGLKDLQKKLDELNGRLFNKVEIITGQRAEDSPDGKEHFIYKGKVIDRKELDKIFANRKCKILIDDIPGIFENKLIELGLQNSITIE